MALTTIGSASEATVRARVERAITGRRSDAGGRAFEAALMACLLLSLAVLGLLVYQVLGNGLTVFGDRGADFLDAGLASSPARAGVAQGIIGSFWIAISVVVLALPLGIGAAIYLEEYAPLNRLTSFIALNSLSGGEGVNRRTLAAAGVTIAVLVLPVVIITTQEAIRAVPVALREGAYGVGATKWEVIRSQVLPYAAPGILTGALLSIARAVGEAAPLIVVGAATGLLGRSPGLSAGTLLDVENLTSRFTALPTIVSTWSKLPEEEFRVDLAAATIITMLVFVLVLNSIAIVLRNRFEKKRSA